MEERKEKKAKLITKKCKKEKKKEKKENKGKKEKKERKEKKTKKRKREEASQEEEELSVAEKLECELFRAAVQGSSSGRTPTAGAPSSIGVEGESNETLARKLGLSASLIRSSDCASALTTSFSGGDDDDNPARRARQKREYVAQRALALARDELARRAAIAATATAASGPSMLEQMKKRFVSSSS